MTVHTRYERVGGTGLLRVIGHYDLATGRLLRTNTKEPLRTWQAICALADAPADPPDTLKEVVRLQQGGAPKPAPRPRPALPLPQPQRYEEFAPPETGKLLVQRQKDMGIRV